MLQIDRRIFTHFDFLIVILVLPIIALSYFLVSEANSMLATKQLVYFGVGLGAFLFFFLLPIRKLEWLIPFLYWIGILGLISVDIFGIERLGAKRWLEIPFVHFTIQPSEIFKPLFLLMMCYLIKKNPPDTRGYNFKDFLKFSFFILLPFVLIMKEPDLGTALLLLLVGYGILFVVGVRRRIWLTLALMVCVASPILYTNLHDYQKKRISDFLSDTPSYHVKQSVIAIGSGGLTGKPKDEATQTHSKFLPIATSDFIFAYLVERFGFFGGLTLILFYALLIIHLVTLGQKYKKDYFAVVMTTGVGFFIFIYMGVNICMTIGLAPV
ncbi:MAG: FtsW/RodA/SpoVE family cell cycle protein, partial [Campylobacteraceae bacterium]